MNWEDTSKPSLGYSCSVFLTVMSFSNWMLLGLSVSCSLLVHMWDVARNMHIRKQGEDKDGTWMRGMMQRKCVRVHYLTSPPSRDWRWGHESQHVQVHFKFLVTTWQWRWSPKALYPSVTWTFKHPGYHFSPFRYQSWTPSHFTSNRDFEVWGSPSWSCASVLSRQSHLPRKGCHRDFHPPRK